MSDSNSSYPNPFSAPPPLPPDAGAQPSVSGKAVAALIFGLLSFVFWILAAIPAIILAATAKSDIRRDPHRFRGNGLATTGLILGILGLIVPVLMIPLMFRALSGFARGPVLARGDRIAHFHLANVIEERPFDEVPTLFAPPGYSLKGLIDRLDRAREDDSVKAVILTTEMPVVGFGQVEELWRALQALKDANKPVYVHGADLQTGMYALASGASHINVVPTDTVWLLGLRLQSFYLAEALEKIGVDAEVLAMGDYKSAGEMLERDGPSDAASENMDWLLDGLYGKLVEMIAQGRGIDPEQVRALIDEGPYEAEAAEEAGLIDSVMFLGDFLEMIKNEHGDGVFIDNYYGRRRDGKAPASFGAIASGDQDDTVAIVYIEGAIVRGYQQVSPFGGAAGAAYSGDLRKTLEAAAESDRVKAVVLRVDSPGGSAVASEEILRAVERVRAEGKPVVVSMGSTAASGGYYVSCKADSIFADAATITASIGVVGGKVATSEMWDALGISWYAWQRGDNADLFDITQPWTDDQRAQILDWMEDTYDVFKENVVEGRGDKLAKPIEEMAGGRVYTGAQALDLGLVDELGGLRDAIMRAADLAGLEEDRYSVRVLPRVKGFWEAFFDAMSGETERPSDLDFDLRTPVRTALGLPGAPAREAALPMPARALAELSPARFRALQDAWLAATALRDERVLAIMPQAVVIE